MVIEMESKKRKKNETGESSSIKKKKFDDGGKKSNKTEKKHGKKPKSTNTNSVASTKPKSPKADDSVSKKSPSSTKPKGDGKTMDYKQYRLKMMKGKWKKDKSKHGGRGDRKSEKKNGSSPTKPTQERGEEQRKKKPIAGVAPKSKKEFGICDFAELSHYYDEFSELTKTTVEREELYHPKFFFANKMKRSPNRFFAKRIPHWKELIERKLPNGSPRLIVICPSDVRSVKLNRDLVTFKGDKCHAIKLIRKEKTKDQAAYLQKRVAHIAIGTPHRIEALIDNGHLKLDECVGIVLDWSFEDVKKRRLITVPETRVDVMQLLEKHFIPLFKSHEEIALMML